MILSGREIHRRIQEGQIKIYPFFYERLGPNSYDLMLDEYISVYKEGVLDLQKNNEAERIQLGRDGFVLQPGELYIGNTLEYTETKGLVPEIDGRSSTGRLGIGIHVSAGRGEIGYRGVWTLEITCVRPVRIYPFMPICQIYYVTTSEDHEEYSGKYQDSKTGHTSRSYQDFSMDFGLEHRQRGILDNTQRIPSVRSAMEGLDGDEQTQTRSNLKDDT